MAKNFNFADAENTPIAQAATETMAEAFEKPTQNAESHEEDVKVTKTESGSTEVTFNNTDVQPMHNGENSLATTPEIMTCIENISKRRMQIISEYNGAAIQALSLKTFPEAGNWKMEEIVRDFNNKRNRSLPKLTKGALAEMLLLDAVDELYKKVCK